jgi:L-ribulose-5-phosphate 3-epimerase
MMRLGVITDEVSQNIDIAVQFSKEFGLNGVELRTVEDKSIDGISPTRLREISAVIRNSGLSVCNLSSSFFKCSLDSRTEIKQNIEKLKRLIEAAHLLQCDSIRGFSFFDTGEFDERFDDICEKFARPAELCQKEGLSLLLEADPSVFTTNCKRLAKLLNALDNPVFGAIYDPGNDIFDPHGEQPFPDGFNVVKPFIRHVHIKDAVIQDGKPRSVKVGTGNVPYPLILAALSAMSYDGYLVLETHYRLHAELTDEMLKLPGGQQFSLNAEDASRESMAELIRLASHYV